MNRLSRNAILAGASQALQITAALVLMPALLRQLGAERVGILSLVWITIGYLSIFDLGIGVAVTRTTARYAAKGDYAGIASVFWTSLSSQSMLGVLGGFVLWFLGPALVHEVLRPSASMMSETLSAFRLAAFAIPAVLVSSAVIGLLQGIERFDCTLWLQAPSSVIQYGLPLLCTLYWGPSLAVTVAALVLSRWLLAGVSVVVALGVCPQLRGRRNPDAHELGRLLRFGGWVTVSGAVSPVLVYADRFMVGHFLSMAAVAFYAVAIDVGMKLLVIPAAVVSALLPRLSSVAGTSENSASRLTAQTLKFVMLSAGPPCVLLGSFAGNFLTRWLGSAVSGQATVALQVVMAGVAANSAARVAEALLQAHGRPDVTALVHLFEAVPLLTLSYFLMHWFGLNGAAFAWSARLILECAVLVAFSCRIGLLQWADLVTQGVATVSAGLLFYAIAVAVVVGVPYPVPVRIGGALTVTAGAAMLAWSIALDPREKLLFVNLFRFRSQAAGLRGAT